MASKPPTVSVIICAYTMERLHDVHEAVNSVLAQTHQPDEIIVCLDHNEELHAKLSDELPPKIIIIRNEGTRGLSDTRNAGIRGATSDIVAFIDDDAIAEENWLANLLSHYDDSSVVAAGGKLVSIWADGRPGWFPEELDWIVGGTYRGHPTSKTRIRNMIGANMSFRSNVCRHVGFFLSELGARGRTAIAGDETEFCMRITHKLPDATMLYDPEAVVYHKVLPYQSTPPYLVVRSYHEGLSKGQTRGIYTALSRHPLSTETAYLRHLLCTTIPEKLRNFYKRGSLLQLGAIFLSIAATGLGYIVGRVRGGNG